MDPVSLYVARRDGWFESGWSHTFIRDCFERSGFQLTFLTGGYYGDEIGIATRSETKREAVLDHAQRLGLREVLAVGSIGDDPHYRSMLGEATTLLGRPAFRQIRAGSDALVHGPYADAVAGEYEVSMIAQYFGTCPRLGRAGSLSVDIIHGLESERLLKARVSARSAVTPRLLHYRFRLAVDATDLEVRAFPHGAPDWVVSLPTIRRVSGA